MTNENIRIQTSNASLFKKFLVVIAAILLYGFISGLISNTSQLATLISEYSGISYGEVSTAFSILNLVFAISIPVIGFLTLKVKKYFFMFAGAVLCAIAFTGIIFSTQAWQLMLFVGFCFGLGAALLSFTIVFSAAQPFFSEKACAILSGVLLASVGGIGMILSPFISGVTESFGFPTCLILISVFSLVLIPFIFIFISRKKNLDAVQANNEEVFLETPPKFTVVLKKLVKHPLFYLIVIGAFAFAMSDGVILNHASQIANLIYDTDKYTSFLISLYTASVMIGALFGGIIAAKAKNKGLLIGVIFLIWLLDHILRIIMSNVLGLYQSDIIILAISTVVSSILINMLSVSIITFAVERVSPVVCATVLSIYDCCVYLSYSMNSLIGGLFYEIFGEIKLIDIFVVVLCLLAGVFFLIYGLKHRHKKVEAVI